MFKYLLNLRGGEHSGNQYDVFMWSPDNGHELLAVMVQINLSFCDSSLQNHILAIPR